MADTPLAVLDDTYARLDAVCKSFGLPTDVDVLVRHLEANASCAGYMTGQNDSAMALQHVGWLSLAGTFYKAETFFPVMYGDRPVFTHDDWLDKVPNTERNRGD